MPTLARTQRQVILTHSDPSHGPRVCHNKNIPMALNLPLMPPAVILHDMVMHAKSLDQFPNGVHHDKSLVVLGIYPCDINSILHCRLPDSRCMSADLPATSSELSALPCTSSINEVHPEHQQRTYQRNATGMQQQRKQRWYTPTIRMLGSLARQVLCATAPAESQSLSTSPDRVKLNKLSQPHIISPSILTACQRPPPAIFSLHSSYKSARFASSFLPQQKSTILSTASNFIYTSRLSRRTKYRPEVSSLQSPSFCNRKASTYRHLSSLSEHMTIFTDLIRSVSSVFSSNSDTTHISSNTELSRLPTHETSTESSSSSDATDHTLQDPLFSASSSDTTKIIHLDEARSELRSYGGLDRLLCNPSVSTIYCTLTPPLLR